MKLFEKRNKSFNDSGPPSLEEVPTLNESIFSCLQEGFKKRATELAEEYFVAKNTGDVTNEALESQILDAQVFISWKS